jgi:hypothetical protein
MTNIPKNREKSPKRQLISGIKDRLNFLPSVKQTRTKESNISTTKLKTLVSMVEQAKLNSKIRIQKKKARARSKTVGKFRTNNQDKSPKRSHKRRKGRTGIKSKAYSLQKMTSIDQKLSLNNQLNNSPKNALNPTNSSFEANGANTDPRKSNIFEPLITHSKTKYRGRVMKNGKKKDTTKESNINIESNDQINTKES